LLRKGKQIGFNEKAFSGIKSTLSATFLPITSNQNKALSDILFSDWINETPKMTMISGIAKVADSEKQFVYNAFPENPHLVIFDRQNLTSRFVLTVKHDFELLITLSMVFVSLLLLISLGRIELTVITSLPMFFSWLITLGFMGITGIRFNIFNIIISSFIFGLGVDYSILMMRGLLSQYRTGVNDMKTYQVSILLSSATTLIGVGVLFFTKHPALNSIALISIVGIISVVIISLSYQSMLTQWLLLNPKEKGRYPMTATNILYALFIVWTPILLITLFLVIYSRLINPLLPLQKNRKQEVFHQIFTFLDRIYIKMNFPLHHIIENNAGEAFQKPAIIISNHQSLIEIPALLRLDPKIIILTGNWIYRHWIFGPVARLAGLIPVSESIDDSLSPIKQRIDDGYSLLIFPEGKRSTNGNIQRFHRDAFYIAEKLNQDILPILNYGGGDFLPRGTFWGKPNRLFTEILPRIAPENQIFGNNYSERTKQVRLFYREEYLKFKTRHTTTSYNALNLRLNYLFRGPVLEWYLRVKMTLENNFDSYCDLLPVKGEILDLGCGYGYISYMLMLTSGERIITGVDYDEKKITLAQHGYLKNDRITFIQADVTEFKITSMDGFLFSDVLHYLSYEKQESLLKDCIRNLRPGGVILIREGNADKEKQHKCTKFIKFFSTKILRLNNTHDGMGKFYFTSAQKLIRIAEEYGLTFEIIDQKRITSNNFFIMRMPLKERSSY
jgi:1-acyl-sn-glycerol-3-phosphate acyltransferase